MAISGTRFDLPLNINPDYLTDQQLYTLINETNHYLNNLEKSGLRWLGLRRKNYHRFSRSWMRISLDLEYFLVNPQANYSRFMGRLDAEYAKFPAHSTYARHLKNLSEFISRGPVFSKEIIRSIEKNKPPKP